MSNNIEGKVVVITGASNRLGAAAARLLLAERVTVVLGARRCERLKSKCKAKVSRALGATDRTIERTQAVRSRTKTRNN
jgi:NADP-dependent 3-hydroxy acid dehydrogenase YdfG